MQDARLAAGSLELFEVMPFVVSSEWVLLRLNLPEMAR